MVYKKFWLNGVLLEVYITNSHPILIWTKKMVIKFIKIHSKFTFIELKLKLKGKQHNKKREWNLR